MDFVFGSQMTTIHSIYDGTNAQQNEALLHTDCGFSDTQLTSDECVEDFLTGRIVGHADVASDEGICYTMACCRLPFRKRCIYIYGARASIEDFTMSCHAESDLLASDDEYTGDQSFSAKLFFSRLKSIK